MTTITRSTERTEFLSDILITGLAAGSYWGTATDFVTDTEGLTVGATIVDFDDAVHQVTLDTVAAGLKRLGSGELAFHNSGYDESHSRLAKLDRTNGDDADYDAIDADAIIQAGALNEITYG